MLGLRDGKNSIKSRCYSGCSPFGAHACSSSRTTTHFANSIDTNSFKPVFLVTAVADGVDALRHIDTGLQPDIVILDLMLPRLNGLDLHREFRAHAKTRNVPIIVVTGTDTRDLNPHDFAFVFRKPIRWRRAG
jgi:CheY-like chemotaxis protein